MIREYPTTVSADWSCISIKAPTPASSILGGRLVGFSVCCLRFVVAVACLLVLVPESAAAHGSAIGSGYATEVAVGVAVALGLVAGFLGVLLSARRVERTVNTMFSTVVALGFLLLGVAFLFPVISESPTFALSGLIVGGGVTKLGVRIADQEAGCPCLRSTDFAAGGIALHRVVEGIALGGAVSVGGHLSLVGVGVVAGHTAVETSLLGAAYAATNSLRGVAAVVGVQLALACGIAVGLVALEAVPPLIETASLALAGSALVVTGVETARARSVVPI